MPQGGSKDAKLLELENEQKMLIEELARHAAESEGLVRDRGVLRGYTLTGCFERLATFDAAK